jgi:hypothetical protein
MVVPDNKDTDRVAVNPIKEMVRKALEVGATENLSMFTQPTRYS